jgi:hypothetical protein
MGKLTWGLTAAPMAWAPPVASVEELVGRAPQNRRIPALTELPIAIVSGDSSAFGESTGRVVAFLRLSGADVTWIELPKLGIRGNGHGIMIEANAHETVRPVAAWLRAEVSEDPSQADGKQAP